MDHEFLELFKEIRSQGGCINFFTYEMKDTLTNHYTTHLAVAKQSLENVQELLYKNTKTKASQEKNKRAVINDFEAFAASGKQISIEEFLGPYFDYDLKKPLVRGVANNATFNDYFLYDQPEIISNSIDIDKRFQNHHDKYPNSSNGFTYAFLEPPYGFGRNKTIQDKGAFFLRVIEQLFSDIDTIEVYTWSTNCSTFFDAGKEWWGTFFYTIYNPIKEMYIGVLASTSD